MALTGVVSLGEKLSGYLDPGSNGEWSYIPLVAGHQWGAPWLSVGTSPVLHLYPGPDEGIEGTLSQFAR